MTLKDLELKLDLFQKQGRRRDDLQPEGFADLEKALVECPKVESLSLSYME